MGVPPYCGIERGGVGVGYAECDGHAVGPESGDVDAESDEG